MGLEGRIMPGPHQHECPDGRVYGLDRELSREQFAVLDGLMRAEGFESREVCWVEFRGERPPIINHTRAPHAEVTP